MLAIWNGPENKTARDAEYVLAADTTLVLVADGTARLLDMGGGFFALSAVGARMLRGVLERGAAATVRELAERYGVAADQVQADLNSLLNELRRRRLLHRGPSRRRGGSLWPALILGPWLRLARCFRFGKTQAAALLILAYLSFAWFGWVRTVALWRRCFRAPSRRDGAPADGETFPALDRTVREAATGLPFRVACKERALCCWALVRSAGAPARLVVGLALFPLAGHCWCESGDGVLSDHEDRCRSFTPVIRYE